MVTPEEREYHRFKRMERAWDRVKDYHTSKIMGGSVAAGGFAGKLITTGVMAGAAAGTKVGLAGAAGYGLGRLIDVASGERITDRLAGVGKYNPQATRKDRGWTRPPPSGIRMRTGSRRF